MSQDGRPAAAADQPLEPSAGQLLLFFLGLGWFATAPVIATLFSYLWPTDWPELLVRLLSSSLLILLLATPAVLGLGLSFWPGWSGFRPLAKALLLLTGYIAVDSLLRAVTEPQSNAEVGLRLTVLTGSVLTLGALAGWLAGVPTRKLPAVLGLRWPALSGILLALGLIGLVTIGWPLSGALGDRWQSQLLLLQAAAATLPEVLFFWGVALGLLSFELQPRRTLATLAALFIYLTFIPSKLTPHQDWMQVIGPVTLLPLALLLIQLRGLTGAVWASALFAVFYQVTPWLFTDPRDELPLITQPWQTLARFWMFLATAGLALALWLVRQYLLPRWSLDRWPALGLTAGAALLVWLGWGGLWALAGYPGFHNDGFLIIMADQADLSGAAEIDDLLARRAFVRERLLEVAGRTQPPVRAALEQAGLDYRPFYLINMIRVEGQHRRMAEFAGLPGVARVLLNPNVRPYPGHVSPGYGDAPERGTGVAWNIDQVEADEVWAMGVTGQGIVVAGQDTGYDWNHPALRRAYRGSTAAGVDHAYHWHDAWSAAAEPFDDDQHGTHTMGTILGDDGNGNQIGMAPGAQWIGCRNMRRGLGNPASYTDCMEFFLAPYPAGSDPFTAGDVSQAPHVINNSWGCPDSEGCDDTVLQPAAAALRAAGIMMVVSAGNEGPACRTVAEPPARYDEVFSVGATDSLGQITGFSSRGPVPDSAGPLLKPDIAAPGQNIRSSVPGGGYGTADGTSMAGPHVTGLVALLWSANPALIGQIEATETIIRQSARPVEVSAACSLELRSPEGQTLLDELEALAAPSECACGEVSGVPNNVYGWGEIDALRAVELARAWTSDQ